MHECLRKPYHKAACHKHILLLCIKIHLFSCQIFFYRNTYGTLTCEAAAKHRKNGVSSPWKSIEEGNSIGAKSIV